MTYKRHAWRSQYANVLPLKTFEWLLLVVSDSFIVSRYQALNSEVFLFIIALVLAGGELSFLPVAAVVWIWYKKNVDNTDVFSCCYEVKDFFPVSRVQLTSRCAGAGREHRQAG